MVGAKWTVDETTALIDAYSDKIVQETIEGIASNKELHEQLQQIMKDQSNVNRTLQQIETRLKALQCLNNIPFSARAVSWHGHHFWTRPNTSFVTKHQGFPAWSGNTRGFLPEVVDFGGIFFKIKNKHNTA